VSGLHDQDPDDFAFPDSAGDVLVPEGIAARPDKIFNLSEG